MLNGFRGNSVVVDFKRCRAHNHGFANSIAFDNALTVHAQHWTGLVGISDHHVRISLELGAPRPAVHCSSPNLLSNKARICSSAVSASSPVASTLTVTPIPAA